MGPRHLGEAIGVFPKRSQHRGGIGTRLRIGFAIGGNGGEQNVRRLVDVGRAETVPIALVKAPAGVTVGLGNRHLLLDQLPNNGLTVGFAAAFGIA